MQNCIPKNGINGQNSIPVLKERTFIVISKSRAVTTMSTINNELAPAFKAAQFFSKSGVVLMEEVRFERSSVLHRARFYIPYKR
jgi:hypothetical protein